jgi:hypothetical protein
METVVYGSMMEGLEVVRRAGRLFVRYDAGGHLVQWREDEITEGELALLSAGRGYWTHALLQIEKRLLASGVDPYKSNWEPPVAKPPTEH